MTARSAAAPAARTAPTAAVAPHLRPVERHLKVVRFGQQEPLDVDTAAVITFPQGLVGMDDLRQFLIIEDPRTTPCRWLQSVEEPALAFVIVDPTILVPEYTAEVSGEDAEQLGLADAQDADVWAIVTVQPEPSRSTVNLLAPVIVNRQNRLGKQVIQNEGGYDLRYPLVAAAGDAPAGA